MSFRSKFLSKSNTKGGKNVEEEKQRPTQAVFAAGKRFVSVLRRGKKEKAFIPADDRRSLYLCFGEYEDGNKVSYTILSVSLRQLLAAPPRKLKLFAKISGDGIPRYMGCGVWGSKILLGGGAKPIAAEDVKREHSAPAGGGGHQALCPRSSFRFDTTDPDQSWRRLLNESGFDYDRFTFKGTSLVVNDGKQFVLFTFQLSAGHHISVHLISYDFSIIKQDYSRVQLPSYLMNYKDDHLGQLPLANYSMVHLGDNTACLLLSELRLSGVDYAKKKRIRCVEPVVFTFKVRDNATSSLKVKFLPRTPMLIYDEDNNDDVDVPPRAGQMLGAFLLEISQVKISCNSQEHLAVE
ncbi:hypothetical protein ACLB2K_072977 [Fragaria x ananassa]